MYCFYVPHSNGYNICFDINQDDTRYIYISTKIKTKYHIELMLVGITTGNILIINLTRDSSTNIHPLSKLQVRDQLL